MGETVIPGTMSLYETNPMEFVLSFYARLPCSQGSVSNNFHALIEKMANEQMDQLEFSNPVELYSSFIVFFVTNFKGNYGSLNPLF